MIRFYSLFVTDENLMTSPYVRRFNPFHDLTLHRSQEETINFLLQTTLTPEQYEQLNILYDPHSLNIRDVEVKTFAHQTLLTVHLTPKEIGSLRIGVAFPQSPALHRSHLKKVSSPFLSVPCKDLSTKKDPISAQEDQYVPV